jgi:hypothetical protein
MCELSQSFNMPGIYVNVSSHFKRDFNTIYKLESYFKVHLLIIAYIYTVQVKAAAGITCTWQELKREGFIFQTSNTCLSGQDSNTLKIFVSSSCLASNVYVFLPMNTKCMHKNSHNMICMMIMVFKWHSNGSDVSGLS